MYVKCPICENSPNLVTLQATKKSSSTQRMQRRFVRMYVHTPDADTTSRHHVGLKVVLVLCCCGGGRATFGFKLSRGGYDFERFMC
jgi:ribosomal protein L44E